LIKFNISIEKRIEELESELSSGHLAHRKPFATKDVGRRGEKPPDSEGPFEARKVLINLLQNKGDSARNLLTELDNLGPTSNENDKINFINNLFDLMDSDEQNKMEQYIREFGKTGLQVSISYAGPGKLNDPHYEMVGEKENSSHIPKWRDRANEFRKRKGSDDIRDQEILYVIQPTIKRLDGIKIQEGRAIVHEKSVS
jgi:hypothetical protein